MKPRLFLATAFGFAIALPALCTADSISFNPGNGVPPVVPTGGLHDIVAPPSIVGTAFVPYGVDFSWGQAETIFMEPAGYVLWGVNNLGQADFQQPIDARIVVPGTEQQGLTNEVSATFYSIYNNVKLDVFSVGGQLIDTDIEAANPFTNRGQVKLQDANADIAFFRISEIISFGGSGYGYEVSGAQLERPSGVPEPSSIMLAAVGLGGLVAWGLASATNRMRWQPARRQDSKSSRL